MKTTILVRAGLATFASALVLSACSGNGGNNSGDAAGKSPAASASADSAVPETGLPLSKELQTIKLVTVIDDGKPPNKDIRFWQNLEKETNVHVEFQDINVSQWKEKKSLMFASNDLPTAILGHASLTDIELLNYGSQGQLIPLEGLIEKYAPNLNKAFKEYPELKKELTAPDGHIYAIPSFDDGLVPEAAFPLFINKKWLDQLGLKVPTTTDEFEQVLLAFKQKDPNGNGKADEIPLTTGSTWGYFSQMFGSFGLVDDYNTHIALVNGKAVHTASQPQFKEAIQYFRKLQSQGLIDNEAFTQDSKVLTSKQKTVPRIAGAFQGWRSSAWANNPEETNDYVVVPPLKGPKGDQAWPRNTTGLTARGSFSITKNAKNPELLMRWADNLLADDNGLMLTFSYRMGDTIEKTADNKIKILRALDWNNPDESLNSPTTSSKMNFMTKSNSKRLLDVPAHMIEKQGFDKVYTQYLEPRFPNVFFSKEESQKLATIGNDLNTYINSMYAKWIMSGGIENEWDSYLKKLNDMGLKDYVGIYQTALERYNQAK